MPQGRSLVPSERQTARQSRPIFFLATFWGKQYRDWFCLYALQSLLSPNNIPGLAQSGFARFLICTTQEDWEALQRESIFKQLKREIDVVFIENDALFPGEHKYHRMSRGHALLAEECFKYSAVAINVNPDSIYPDGCVCEAERLFAQGKDVVLCTAVRFEMEGVRDELSKAGALNWGHPLTLPRRQAVELGLRNLHAETRASDWRAPNFGLLAPEHERTHLLTCCYWRIPDDTGCIIVTHNWAPFLVNYAALQDHNADSLDGRAIDGDYIFENFGDGSDSDNIHVVTDSDSIFLLGLTPKAEMVPPEKSSWWKNLPLIGFWSRGYILNQTVFDTTMDPLKRRLYRTKVRWHSQDMSPSWNTLDRFVEKCLTSFASDDLAGRQSLKNPFRQLWYRVIHTDAFRPFGAPTRLQFVMSRLLELAKKGKPYIYLRALVRAFRGDRMARERIKSRSRRMALYSSGGVVALALVFGIVNVAAYYVLQATTPQDSAEPNISSPGAENTVRTGLAGIRYESAWDDAYVQSLLASPGKAAFVLGGENSPTSSLSSDHTIAAELNRLSANGAPVFLTLTAERTGVENEIQSLVRLLQKGVRPANVIVLTSWRDVFSPKPAQQRDARPADTLRDSAATLVSALPVYRLIRERSLNDLNPFGSQPRQYVNGVELQNPKLDKLTAIRLTDAEKHLLRQQVRTTFRENLLFLQELAQGFGFESWIFHQPIALSDPRNKHVPALSRSADFLEFAVVLNEELRRTISSGIPNAFDLTNALKDADTNYFDDAVSLSAAANNALAREIHRIVGTNK